MHLLICRSSSRRWRGRLRPPTCRPRCRRSLIRLRMGSTRFREPKDPKEQNSLGQLRNRSWIHLRRSSAAHGPLLEALEPLLDPSWSALGRSWTDLTPPGTLKSSPRCRENTIHRTFELFVALVPRLTLGPLGQLRNRSWIHLGRSWALLDPSWPLLGALGPISHRRGPHTQAHAAGRARFTNIALLSTSSLLCRS